MLIALAVKAYKDPHLSCDSTKEEKDFNFLVEMYKSAQDVLTKQAEQEKAIQKCKNKVHFMTEEMETLQRRTTKEAMYDKVSNILIFPSLPIVLTRF